MEIGQIIISVHYPELLPEGYTLKLEDHLAGCETDISKLILRIGDVSKTISRGFASRQSSSDTKNVYGEQQMALDKWADDVLIADLRESGLVHYLASEEQPDIIEFENASGDLGVTLDPLDGSSLIGVNLAVGTIVGIYKGNVLSPGIEMVGAMYVLYGPLTTLTYTIRKGVHEFVLNDDGQFVLQEENIRMPEGQIYAPGALRKNYLPCHLKWIESLEAEGYKIRFSGSFVADVHQILHKGGVFTYPGFIGKEEGKLRLLFEGNPMGFIVTEAGGATSDGTRDLLSIKPEAVSQRVPIYIGGKKEIELIEKFNSEV
jgi:fructose-1,6-bisphosphatase I